MSLAQRLIGESVGFVRDTMGRQTRYNGIIEALIDGRGENARYNVKITHMQLEDEGPLARAQGKPAVYAIVSEGSLRQYKHD